MKRTDRGFTLAELMVVIAVWGIMAALALLAYRQGLYREYDVSKEMRSLVNAIQLARMRAIESNTISTITQGVSSTSAGSGWYSKVTFTAPNHGLQTGDCVIFSGLSAHSGMNVGTYSVTVSGTDTFVCDYYSKVPTTSVDSAGAVARNVSRAAQLVIMKQSANPTQAQLDSPGTFAYNDKQVMVWDAADTTLNSTTLAGSGYQVTVGFDSRGFAVNPAGYQLAVAVAPAADMVARKRIRVSPMGKVSPGS